ncbi:amino acid ABC transporter ATP-binding/permease protein [Variovorax sp. OV329]|uniref:amino acid ABC transporter ATP-binding/permease protein n=1 Tax=Variovorax sp. OV329 TaxID=1882825 RepID=UPI0008E02257|nr:ATP-binding cassette domain-containing protein [Variovorax sp. OV329]SFM05289.1 ATP-binding cassette, subfamily C, CydC [Variovorax sp. OV329]
MRSPELHAGEVRTVLRACLQAQPRTLALGAGLALLTVLAGMALLGLSGWFIAATALAGLQAATAIVFDVFMPSAGIRLLAIGRTASRYGERLLTHDATLSVTAGLREQLFRGWAQPEAARRLHARPARLLFRLTADIDALESLYLRVMVPALSALGAALLAAVAFGVFAAAWVGGAVVLWLLLCGAGIAVLTALRARRASMRRGLALERLRERVVDLVAGQTELVMAGRIDAQCEAVARADARLLRAETELHRLEARAGWAWGAGSALLLSGSLMAAAWLVDAGRIGAPVAALLVLLSLAAMEPFAALRRGAVELGRSLLAVRRIAPRLKLPQAEATTPASPEAGIAAQCVGLVLAHAGSALPAVAGFDLCLEKGERVAIVGASGAGKSTVLAAIAGELHPRGGTLKALPACWLTQRSELFQDDVRGNLRLADENADDARLWQALQDAGLAEDVHAMPQGLGTRLGEGGLGLSGGQARRLALARLLLRKDTPLWLLDEPSEGLDTRTAQDVLERLGHEAQRQRRSLVVATHLRREAALADRLLCMRGGIVVADHRRGTPGFEAALRELRPD